jgi:hypothetical protein
MAAFTREISRRQWLEAAEILDSGTELPSAQLTQLQSCVTAFFAQRAGDMRRTLKGGGDIAKEVSAAGWRQAEQVRRLWPLLGSRISVASLAAANSRGGIAAVGEHTNSAWTRVLAAFMKEHILQVTQEDAADYMGKPDTAVKAKLQFGNASAGGGAGGRSADRPAADGGFAGQRATGGQAAGGGRQGSQGQQGAAQGTTRAAATPGAAAAAAASGGLALQQGNLWSPESADILGPAIGMDKHWITCRK